MFPRQSSPSYTCGKESTKTHVRRVSKFTLLWVNRKEGNGHEKCFRMPYTLFFFLLLFSLQFPLWVIFSPCRFPLPVLDLPNSFYILFVSFTCEAILFPFFYPVIVFRVSLSEHVPKNFPQAVPESCFYLKTASARTLSLWWAGWLIPFPHDPSQAYKTSQNADIDCWWCPRQVSSCP